MKGETMTGVVADILLQRFAVWIRRERRETEPRCKSSVEHLVAAENGL